MRKNMRLIDADALKEQILDWISEQVVSKYVTHAECIKAREGARVALNMLGAAPTIEAVPVVRGEWLNTYNSGYRPNPENVCSVCDCWNVRRSDYCPNCGADMRGSEVKE